MCLEPECRPVQPHLALQTKERVDQKEDGRVSSQDPKGFKSHLK